MTGPETDLMSTDNSGKFLTVLTKRTETQNSLENRINALAEKISQPQQSTSGQNTSQPFNNQQKWRGNSRGRFNQNRGYRGYNNNHGSYNFQNQNQGRYGNIFRGNSRGRNNYRGNIYRGNNRGNYSNNDSRNNNFQQHDNQNVGVTRELLKDTLRQQHFRKKFFTHVVILITQRRFVK